MNAPTTTPPPASPPSARRTADATPGDDARGFVAWWKRRALPLIALAAIIPLLTIADDTKSAAVVVIVWISWIVFLVDLVVSIVDDHRYLRRPVGWLDLTIVVITFPWYLLPGVSGGVIVTIARLARLARVAVLGVRVVPVRRLVRRLGTTAGFIIVFTFVASLVVYDIQKGSDGFDSFGDALWWGVMTVTTVGYGDIVPTKAEAQWVAGVLMFAGVAAAGTLAGALAAFLRTSTEEAEDRRRAAGTGAPTRVGPTSGTDAGNGDDGDGDDGDDDETLDSLLARVEELHRRIAAMARRESDGT